MANAQPVPQPESPSVVALTDRNRTASDLVVPSPTQALIVVEPIKVSDLVSTRSSMTSMLAKVEGGDVFLEEARKLASEVDLNNLERILEYGHEAGNALASVADQMIGERRLGGSGPVQELFSSMANLEDKLDVGTLTRPVHWLTEFARNLPLIGNRFEPVVRFFERFKKIKPEIDSKEQQLVDLEADRVTSKNELRSLKGTVINGFRSLEISIAAGEIVLQRELDHFSEQRKKVLDSQDVVQMQALKDQRIAISNLDNRVMRLQTARIDAMMDLPMIDLAIDNEEKLRSTLEDLRKITIPQIRKAVAIAISIYDQRKALQVGGDLQELNNALREANLSALGMAQQETHAMAVKGAQEVEKLIASMTTLSELVKNGNKLLEENQSLNEVAREKLHVAEKTFRLSLKEALQD